MVIAMILAAVAAPATADPVRSPNPLTVIPPFAPAVVTRDDFVERAAQVYQRFRQVAGEPLSRKAVQRIYETPYSKPGEVRVPFVRYDATFELIDANHDDLITQAECLSFATVVFGKISVGGSVANLNDPAVRQRLQLAGR